MKDPCEGEREKPKINNDGRIRLDLKTKMVSFVIFQTFLVFFQTLGLVSEIYPKKEVHSTHQDGFSPKKKHPHQYR